MKNNLVMDKEKYPKRDYMSISAETKYFPKKSQSLTIRKMVNCSECGKDSIVSINFDVKTLKKFIENNKKPKEKRDKNLDKLFEALVNTPPPKQ